MRNRTLHFIILRIKRMLVNTLIWLAVLYVLLLVGARLLENSFIYYPSRYPVGRWDPEKFGLRVRDVYLTTRDSVKIHGWFAEANGEGSQDEAERKKVILLFHGNGGNITDRIEKIAFLKRSGASVFCIDYRGYGRSDGKPNEKGIYEDGQTAYRFLVEKGGFEPTDIVVMGESLGGAVACEVATKYPVGGLILESTMANARSLALRTLPILPPSLYLRTRFDNIGKIQQVKAPVLIICGTVDTTIPPSHSTRLFNTANAPKQLVQIDGASHNDVFTVGGAEYENALRQFLEQTLHPS